MTTYTLSGVLQVWTDTDGDGEDDTATFSSITAVVVAPQNASTFSYSSGPDYSAEVQTNFYYATVGDLRLSDLPEGEIDIFHVETESGYSSDLLMFNLDGGVNAIFSMRGDAFPVFASTEEFQSFVSEVTFGAVSPDVAPGIDIAFASFTGTTVTDHDRITGTEAGESYSGGRGRDIIRGLGGDDQLRGGDHKDRLYGGADDDLLDGGRGDDIMDGGFGQDRFLFRTNFGNDRVYRFQDDVDTIILDSALWDGTLTVEQVVDTYANVVNGAVVLDFGDDSVRIRGLADVNQLLDDLIII